MFDYLLAAANVVCLAACVYIVHLLLSHARRTRKHAGPPHAPRGAANGTWHAASSRHDAYFMM